MKFVGVSGTLSGYKVLKVVHEVLKAAKKSDPSIETEIIDLKDFDVEFATGVPLSYYNDDTQNVVHKILDADVLLFGMPVYQASLPGALKNVFDLLPIKAFKGKVAGFISTGGSERHFMVAEYNLVPILHYFEAITPTKHIFVHNDKFDEDSDLIDQGIYRRIEQLAEEMVELQKKLSSNL